MTVIARVALAAALLLAGGSACRFDSAFVPGGPDGIDGGPGPGPDAGLDSGPPGPGDSGGLVCVPSSQSCDGADLQTCDAAGLSVSVTTCPLGCLSGPPAHCGELAPSNGVTAEMADPVGAALAFTADGTIDTTTCMVTEGGAAVPVGTATLPAGGGAPGLCILLPASFAIAGGVTVTVTGNRALAVLAAFDIDLGGTLDASGSGMSAGPGGGAGGSNDLDGDGPGAGSGPNTGGEVLLDVGGGGGGFCATGGDGATVGVATGPGGGGPYGDAELTPLFAGSGGGGGADLTGAPGGMGGGGGGAVQLVSLTSVGVRSSGAIHAGGGGGIQDGCACEGGGGGGSGGAILLEAPNVTIESGGTLAANGGGGAAAASGGNGADATASAMVAGGGGTTGGDGSADGTAVGMGGSAFGNDGGGGGGAAGRIRINAFGTGASVSPSAVISPAGAPGCFTTGAVGVQ